MRADVGSRVVPYSFHCPACHRAIDVLPVQAGSMVVCHCGAQVRVPSLGQLRQQAGQGAYESGTISTIARMIAEGSLPGEQSCVLSHRPTADVLELDVELEQLHFDKKHTWSIVALALISPFLMGMATGKSKPPVGRDTKIRVPLRVDCEHHLRLTRHAGQRRLKMLLKTVPIYAQLLREYPNAKVTAVARDAANDCD